MSYYVYAHTKPDQTVFYVGKGTRGRAWATHGRNTHWQRTVAKYGHNVILLADNLTQEQAIEEEAAIIAYFKPFGSLVNILDRGDISPTCNPEVAAKVSVAASRWQTGRKLSEKHKESLRGPRPNMRGRKHFATKPFYQYNKRLELICIWYDGTEEFAKKFNMSAKSVRGCLLGKRNSCYGNIFSYKPLILN